MNVASLCSGYGGLEIAVENIWPDAVTVCHAEVDPWASKVLAAHWPGVPNVGDLTTVDWSVISEPVDILTAGFPCQPFSTAGRRGGETDDRHLWPFVVEAIRALRPGLVLLENVGGLLSVGGTFAEPTDRCVCGWPHRRRGLHRPVPIENDLRDQARRGHDHQSPDSAPCDATGVRRDGQVVSGSDRQMGSGSGLAGLRAASGGVLDPVVAPSGPEEGTRPAGLAGGGDPARPAEDAHGSVTVDTRCVRPVRGDLRTDQVPEPEGTRRPRPGRVGVERTVCPSCGRPVVSGPEQLVFRSGLGTVYRDLAEAGYDTDWTCLRASDVGACHRRERVFIAAHPHRTGRQSGHGLPATDRGDGPTRSATADTDGCESRQDNGRGGRTAPARQSGGPQRRCESRSGIGGHTSPDAGYVCGEAKQSGTVGAHQPHDALTGGRAVVQAFGTFQPAVDRWADTIGRPAPAGLDGRRLNARFVEWMMGLPDGWVTGIAPRRHALRILGNGVVPQQAAAAYRSLVGAA